MLLANHRTIFQPTALGAVLALLVSNGSCAVRAKFTKSAMACSAVRYCNDEVFSSGYGDDMPQYRSEMAKVRI